MKKLRQKDLINDEEYQKLKTDILLKFVTKRDEIEEAEANKPRFSFASLLGIDLNDPDQAAAVKAVEDVFAQINKAAEDSAQKRIDAIQSVIDATEEQIQAQQDIIDKEKELSDKGLANDLGNQQAALDDLKKKKAEEIKSREDAQKHLEDIHKRQAIIQSASILASNIETGVNMIQAASKIFAAHSGIPFAGVLIAAGLITLMLSTFAQIKAAFKSNASDIPKLRHGGGKDIQGQLLKGASHENGGIGLYDERTHRKIAEYEGDEYLFAVNKKSTAKYRSILEAINSDMLPVTNASHLKSILSGARLPTDKAREVIVLHKEVYNNHIVETSSREELLEITASIKKFHKTIQESEKKLHRVDMGDYWLEIEGNRRRKIYKKRG